MENYWYSMRSLCFVFAILNSLFLLAAPSVWDGSRSKFTKGIGIESDPFIISSASQLAFLSDGGTYEGKFFSVETDIDLASLPWTPIGAFENVKFMGNIDFNGHSIINLNVNSDRAAGLFGYIENSMITNLILKESNIKGLNLAGGVAADANLSILSNIENYSNIYSTGGLASVGGIVGIASSCTIEGVINYGTINNSDEQQTANEITQSYIGGIVGKAAYSKVKRCGNVGGINAYSVMATAKYYTGGIVGCCENSDVSYCFNKADVTCRLRYVRWGNGGTISYVAGIANISTSDFSDPTKCPKSCYNTGCISGSSYWGGLYAAIVAGHYYAEPCENCYSTWNIVGCQASSYTCNIERGNGIKVTLDELNSTAIINQLNNENEIFCKDIYPFINGGTPFFKGIKKYNIKTESPSEITTTSAILRGAISYSGCEVIKRGFNIRTVSDTNYSTIYTFSDEELIDNLCPNQRYSYNFFAELSTGEIIKGEDIEFTTEKLKSEIYTLEAEDITDESAIINGAVILNNNEVLLELGVEYSTPAGTTTKLIGNIDEPKLPYFSLTLLNLTQKTTYRYRVYAKLDKGIIYGDYKTFKTSENSSLSEVTISNPNIEIVTNGVIIKDSSNCFYSIYSLSGILISQGKVDCDSYFVPLPNGIFIICGKVYRI